MIRIHRLPLPAAALAISLWGGCSADQAPFNRLTALRVLAIQSEPAAPTTGETATLSALVYTPTDDPTLSYLWEWCPFPGPSEDGYRCLVSHDEVAMFGAVPAFELGDAPTAMLPNIIDPAALAGLCAGVPGAPSAPDCTGGFPIQIRLTVRTAGGSKDEVIAVVTSRWRFTDPMTQVTQSPNVNPTVDDLTATIGAPPPQPISDQTPTLTLPRDTATPIQAVIAESASEPYDGRDDSGNPATLQERLFVTWFVETGDTNDRDTSFISGRTPFAPLLKNAWTPALKKDYAPNTARLFVVLHDNRGGVGWRSGIVNLDETP